MARNGSGTYNLPAGNPVITGTTISSTTHNNTMADIATALTGSLAADGQTPPTANLPMASYKHTAVGNAAARDQYAAAGQVQDGSFVWLGTGGGTADVITASSTPAFTAYAAGQTFRFISSGANTTNATININSIGAKAITKNGTTALVAGDIPSGAVCEIVYDGTQFQLVNVAPAVSVPTSVSGLSGNVNSSTPLTKFDLSADSVTLRNSSGYTVTRYNASALTCDLGLAGPAANGRDQAGAFTANSWINLFYIWNGTTLATTASTAAHTTGPTLPSGYTHWCYATTLRWNASSNIIPCFARGRLSLFNVANSVTRVLNGGAATTMTAVDCSAYIPPEALTGLFKAIVQSSSASASADLSALYRVTGSTHTGDYIATLITQVAGVTATVLSRFETPVSVSRQIDYRLNATPTSGGLFLDVVGYTIPNGDV